MSAHPLEGPHQENPLRKIDPAEHSPATRVDLSFQVEPGTQLHVSVETVDADGKSLGKQVYVFSPGEAGLMGRVVTPRSADSIRAWLLRCCAWSRSLALPLDSLLLSLSVGLYLLTRLVGLVDFPIYFFTDEAIQVVQAADLITHNLFSPTHEFLPTFFVNGNQYNLGVSVYLQVIPYLLFGKSEWAARAVAVLVTACGTVALGLILRDIFKIRHGGWSGLLLLSIVPAWFYHSRTAFETTLAVSFYVGFLYFYLRYRYCSPRYLVPALILGGLSFYSYSPSQLVVVVTGFLLLLSDWRYHWQNARSTAFSGLGVLFLLALPYLRFLLNHPGANSDHLRILNSYWLQSIPLVEKLRIYFSQYFTGLNPLYWYLPNEADLPRHLMKGYGHILWVMLPLAGLGLFIIVRNLRSPAHRAVLIALLAAPTGAALAEIGITRMLVFIIPATLLAGLGTAAVWTWLEKRGVPRLLVTSGLFVALVLINLGMLSDTLRNAPTWFSDYGLGGMQWGARQVFTTAQHFLEKYPDDRILVSPTWANGTDVIARFFIPDNANLALGNIDGFLLERKPLDSRMVFVMTADEYNRMLASRKFKDIQVEQQLPYPNGKPGFYFVRLQYSDQFDALILAEKEERRKLLDENLSIHGQNLRVRFSRLDMGEIKNLFDSDPGTLCRTLEANPMVVDLIFERPTSLRQVEVLIGGTATQVTARVSTSKQNSALVFEQKREVSNLKRNVALDLGQVLNDVTELRLEIFNVNDMEPAHVHVWEISLQ